MQHLTQRTRTLEGENTSFQQIMNRLKADVEASNMRVTEAQQARIQATEQMKDILRSQEDQQRLMQLVQERSLVQESNMSLRSASQACAGLDHFRITSQAASQSRASVLWSTFTTAPSCSFLMLSNSTLRCCISRHMCMCFLQQRLCVCVCRTLSERYRSEAEASSQQVRQLQAELNPLRRRINELQAAVESHQEENRLVSLRLYLC